MYIYSIKLFKMTVKKNRNDFSSSEDEELQNALKEATDHKLFENTSFSTKKSETSKTTYGQKQSKHPAKSLRKNVEEKQNEFSNFGVTPTFQNYVAKKLNEILQNSVDDNNKVEDDIINEKGNDLGIKLLNSSITCVVTEKEVEKSQKRKIETTIDDEENYIKCKEVAVDPEWILSKVETKAWTSKRKEPEFQYKRLKSGILVEKS
ncbi:uncharacterized protein LOC117609889 [Osmia lignaria lignaria]|uniref:uncharacterized protein LOC117609889 n=1 Tax=Osmia lignaria lignaria TaxID=1437193 RepID=UPI00402BD2EB